MHKKPSCNVSQKIFCHQPKQYWKELITNNDLEDSSGIDGRVRDHGNVYIGMDILR